MEAKDLQHRRPGTSLPIYVLSDVNSESLLLCQLPEVPFRVFAAGHYDFYRKPLPGTWTVLERVFGEDNVKIGQNCPDIALSTF